MARGLWKPKTNAELIENVKTLRRNAEDIVGEITFEHVKSHIGIKFNELADDCAVPGAAGCEQKWPRICRKPMGPGWQEVEMIKSENIKKISEVYEENRLILIAEVLKSKQISYDKENDPIRDFLVEKTYKNENFVGKHRDGPLRHNWWDYGIAGYW